MDGVILKEIKVNGCHVDYHFEATGILQPYFTTNTLFIEYQEDETGLGVIGKVVRTLVEEENLKNDKLDIDSLEAIAFDPYTHGYYKVSQRVGEAFSDGKKLIK